MFTEIGVHNYVDDSDFVYVQGFIHCLEVSKN